MKNIAEKPFSQACENNKSPILSVLQRAFAASRKVLEVGSGTGQHAVYFAKHLQHLEWHTSDQVENHEGIQAWIDDEALENIHPPIEFKMPHAGWPLINFDGVFSANTAHIMQQNEVQAMMRLIERNLPKNGVFCQYGPFKLQGKFTSESNENFHQHLVSEGYGGYRDVAELKQWAPKLTLVNTHIMPANNLLLEWRKER